MMIKSQNTFQVRCDVCGRIELYGAASHSEAWDKLKRAAWCVRKNAFPIIHICPECPVEVERQTAKK